MLRLFSLSSSLLLRCAIAAAEAPSWLCLLLGYFFVASAVLSAQQLFPAGVQRVGLLLLLLQLGTALDEVLGAIANSSTSTSESLGGTEARDALVRQTLLLLQQLIVAAKKLEPWKPVSPARAAEETRQKAKQRPMDVSDLEVSNS